MVPTLVPGPNAGDEMAMMMIALPGASQPYCRVHSGLPQYSAHCELSSRIIFLLCMPMAYRRLSNSNIHPHLPLADLPWLQTLESLKLRTSAFLAAGVYEVLALEIGEYTYENFYKSFCFHFIGASLPGYLNVLNICVRGGGWLENRKPYSCYRI